MSQPEYQSLLIIMQKQQQKNRDASTPPLIYSRHTSVRFLFLFLVIVVAFVNQYAFNNPQALEDSMEKILHIKQSQFQLFYSLFALPNVFTLFFVGFYCDKFGARLSLTVISGLIAVFQLVITIGGYLESYSTILVGRILFGMVSQALFIPQASIVSFWFRGKEQALALGIAIIFPQLGNAFNSFLTPIIFEITQSLGSTLCFSFGLCVMGFICSLLAAFLDYRADKIDEKNNIEPVDLQMTQEEPEEIKFTDIKKLKKSFWIVMAICTAALSVWIPFLDNVNKMFQVRFCFTQVTAGKAISIFYLVTVATSVPIGLFVDANGKRRILTVAAQSIFLIAQFIFLVYPQCSEDVQELGVTSGLVFEAIGYSLYANVIAASIPLVTNTSLLGTAFGIMGLLESFFQFMIPLITGFIVSSSSTPAIGYRYSSLLFVVMAIIGLSFTSMLYFSINEHCKHKLDRSSKQNELIVKLKSQDPTLVSQSSETSNQLISKQEAITVEKQKSQHENTQINTPLLSFEYEL